jgi:hypothetical protein
MPAETIEIAFEPIHLVNACAQQMQKKPWLRLARHAVNSRVAGRTNRGVPIDPAKLRQSSHSSLSLAWADTMTSVQSVV